ncbi:MAG: nucleoside triphosphate pyrophosphohydrolase [Desulfotomaculaceae bacterium]
MQRIVVVGLGPGDWQQLTVQAFETLRSAKQIFLRTEQHPAAAELKRRGLEYTSFDYLYEEKLSFREVYETMTEVLLKTAQTAPAAAGPVVFAVPGHPLVAERAVEMLLEQAKTGLTDVEVEIIPAMSGIEAMYTSLGVDPTRGLCILDGLSLETIHPQPKLANIVLQVYNPRIASEVKLTLMEYYPDDFKVWVVKAAGIPGAEHLVELPLYELDRLPWVDHLTSVYLPPNPAAPQEAEDGRISGASLYPLDKLVTVMDALLGPDGCPWDREQTHASLRPYLIEETYEVIEALDKGDMEKFADELGDLLLQIVFHAALAQQNEYFDINDVILKITQKMIRRHPHVFGEEKVKSTGEVLINWEEIKQQEAKADPETESYLAGIPSALPALVRADKVQSKAARVGFDWPSVEGVKQKVREEFGELEEALNQGDQAAIFEELGDLFFSIVNLARYLKVDSEGALSRTIDKFIRRFNYIEQKGSEAGKKLREMSLEEMDFWWEEAKLKKILD